jgi:steroid 5-alpha reductase family enzyme
LVRCPNYFGELLFWTGCALGGIPVYRGPVQWIIVLAGYIGIIYVMFSGARRLEIRQNKNYGGDPEYRKYVKSVPILVPFIPLYSVEKYKWLVA